MVAYHRRAGEPAFLSNSGREFRVCAVRGSAQAQHLTPSIQVQKLSGTCLLSTYEVPVSQFMPSKLKRDCCVNKNAFLIIYPQRFLDG